METMQKNISKWYINSTDDDELVEKLKSVVKQNGAGGCQAILQTLAHLNLDVGTARKCWDDVLAHRETLSLHLDREVTLVTAMCDYLCSQAHIIRNPTLVDVGVFDQVVKDSTHDGLTGLHNRVYFAEALEQQLLLSERHDQDLSILFLDVDDFKDINDTFGHSNGDVVLRRIAATAKQEARTSDVVARYGGEEFVILMPHTDYISALVLAERVRKKIQQEEITLGGEVCRLTVSGGIASFPIHAKNAKDLLNLADSALYRAKGAGKNNISLFKEDKRRFVRTKLNSSVKIKEMGFHASPTLLGTSKDICIGGILFENEEVLPIGSMIQVSILINKNQPILLIGTVVRVEAYGPKSFDIGMAISFKEMEKNAKDEISKFLLSQSEGHEQNIAPN